MELEPKKFYRFLSPRPAVLLTTIDGDKNINAAPFSFVMPVSMDPPLLAIAIGTKQSTLSDIRNTREFVVNVPPESIIDRFWACSQERTQGIDQLRKTGLTEVPSAKVLAPSVGECNVWFECFLEFEKELGDHVVVVGRVVNLTVKDEVLGKDGNLDLKKAASIMHISGQKFAVAEREITPKPVSNSK
jgi:flavin reductase (DIM6/NTAB) family NADH-FMN oxidoreductase RutF